MAFVKRRKKDKTSQPPHIEREKIVSRLDQTIVDDGGKVKPPSRLGRLVKPLWAKPLFRKALLIGLPLVIAVAAAGTYFVLKPDKPVANVPSCSGQLLVRARENLDPGKHEELKKITDEIKQVPNYEQNSTCLVILLTYAINNSKPAEARDYLNKLEKAYNEKEGYDNSIARNVKKPEQYKADVALLEKLKTDYANTQKNRSIPPEAPGSTQ